MGHPGNVAYHCMVFTWIRAAMLSKFFTPQTEHLFEGSTYLNATLFYLKVTCNKELSHVNGIITFSIKLTE